MSLVTNVFRRGAIFYFRARVPARLTAVVGRRELWRSLKTSDHREARQRASRAILLTAALWRDFERLMSSRVPSRSEVKALIDQWLKAELDRDETLRRASELDREGKWWAGAILVRDDNGTLNVSERLDEDELQALLRAPRAARKARVGPRGQLVRGFNDIAHERGARYELHGDAAARHADGDTSVARRLLDDLLDGRGIDLPKDSDAYDHAARMMLAAQAKLAEAMERRQLAGARRNGVPQTGWRPGLDDDPVEHLVASLDRPTPVVVPLHREGEPQAKPALGGRASMRLSEASQRATQALARTEGWRPGRSDDYRHAVDTFIDWLGRDPMLVEITAEMAGDFQEALGRYPSNAMKRIPYRDMGSFRERLDASIKADEASVLSPTTINGKYLTPLRSILASQMRAGSGLPNPFDGIKAKQPRKPSPDDRRRDFSLTELQRLFDLPVFTGAYRAHGSGSARRGSVMIRDWRFWVPLICIFSGMRLNEACGLAIADLKHEKGIAYFHVRDELEGQSLKTTSSRRKVPVHNALIELGLLDQVAAWKAGGQDRFFPDLELDRRGYYSRRPSKLFNGWIPRIVDPEPEDAGKLVFYSSRHTVISRLRAADVRQDVAQEIVGHEQDSVHAGYGKFDIQTLKTSLDRVEYPGLDLSRLKPTIRP